MGLSRLAILPVTDPTNQGSGAPNIRVLGAIRPHSRGQPQSLQGRNGGKGVADLCREGTDQEVSKGVLAEPAS
jgi:hypothetical protein